MKFESDLLTHLPARVKVKGLTCRGLAGVVLRQRFTVGRLVFIRLLGQARMRVHDVLWHELMLIAAPSQAWGGLGKGIAAIRRREPRQGGGHGESYGP